MRSRSAGCWMIRMICGVKLANRVCSAELYQRVGMEMPVQDVIVKNRLFWYGYLMHRGKETQIPEVLQNKVAIKRLKKRPRKTWLLVVVWKIK